MTKALTNSSGAPGPTSVLEVSAVRTIVLVLLNICDFLIVMEIIFTRESLITLVICSYNNYRMVQTK